MTLIKSISGIRGTIGGKPGYGLFPIDIVKFTTAYATFIQEKAGKTILEIADNEAFTFAENLIEVAKIVKEKQVDVCFVVDPDVDRLVILNETEPCLTKSTRW